MISNRKEYIQIFMLVFFMNGFLFSQDDSKNVEGWKNLPKILKRITPPKFPSREFDITQFGAVGDGSTDCTLAIQEAIDKCSHFGGGKVVVPKGTFLSGAINLKSKVNLYISDEAILKFSTDPKKYLPVVFTRWEGVECLNYSSLIYAYEQENIAITGKGTLDGQASDDNWWSWKASKKEDNKYNQKKDVEDLYDMGQKGRPVEKRIFGDGHYLRPNFVQFYKCKNILIRGITIKNSPMWVIHPVLSRNISILDVKTIGLGPNNDGCDPESCTDILIKNCYFNNGDDCIAIKSGRNNDGRRVNVPTENVVIQDCKMNDGHGGVVIGSEVSGSVRNVYAENCTMDSPNLERALRFKTNSFRGGVIENVYARNIKVGQVKYEVIRVDFYYGEGDKGEFTPVLKNIYVNNLTSNKSPYALWMKAYERSPVSNFHLENCTFENVLKENVLENVKNISLKNVKINGKLIKTNSQKK